MKWIQYIVIVAFFNAGCKTDSRKITSSRAEDNVYVYLLNKYRDAKDFFGKDMTDHFPNSPDFHLYNYTESFSPVLGNLELILWNMKPIQIQNESISRLINNSIENYSADDSCLLIVNRFVNRKDLHKVNPSPSDMKMVERICYDQKKPVPNFWHTDYTTEVNSCKLSSDFELYVLEAKPGKCLEEELLTEGQYMPLKWKNGYSKGIAISKKEGAIIYWLTIW